MSKTTTHHKQKLAIYVPKTRTEQLQSIGLSGQTVQITIPTEVEDFAIAGAAVDGMAAEAWIIQQILEGYTMALEGHMEDGRELRTKLEGMKR